MNQHRMAARFLAGLASVGIIIVGGLTVPAQADSGWNRTVTPAGSAHHPRISPHDTGWN